jgi:hypothetical protein
MAVEHGDAVYSLGLLRDIAGWSVPIALACAFAGSALTHDVSFGVSCLIGAAADVGMLLYALRRTRDVDAHEALTGRSMATAFVIRLGVKSALLVLAAVVPAYLNVLGMAVGVLTTDITLATAGSVEVAWHTFRPDRSGR